MSLAAGGSVIPPIGAVVMACLAHLPRSGTPLDQLCLVRLRVSDGSYRSARNGCGRGASHKVGQFRRLGRRRRWPRRGPWGPAASRRTPGQPRSASSIGTSPRVRNGRRRPRCGAVTIRPSARKLEPRIKIIGAAPWGPAATTPAPGEPQAKPPPLTGDGPGRWSGATGKTGPALAAECFCPRLADIAWSCRGGSRI
jgi:hypothetical protein